MLKSEESILIKGEIYLVPCLEIKKEIISKLGYFYEDKNSLDPFCYTPVLNLPHSDKENGQPEIHYHLDDRFKPLLKSKLNFIYLQRPRKSYVERVILIAMECKYVEVYTTTPVTMIKNSKLKHKCIFKNKCPHRGFDLSTTQEDSEGILTCPLHGLKFKNKILIN